MGRVCQAEWSCWVVNSSFATDPSHSCMPWQGMRQQAIACGIFQNFSVPSAAWTSQITKTMTLRYECWLYSLFWEIGPFFWALWRSRYIWITTSQVSRPWVLSATLDLSSHPEPFQNWGSMFWIPGLWVWGPSDSDEDHNAEQESSRKLPASTGYPRILTLQRLAGRPEPQYLIPHPGIEYIGQEARLWLGPLQVMGLET